MTGGSGGPGTEYGELQQRYLEARQAFEDARRELIAAAATYPGTSREWAEATGTNRMDLGRLRGAHNLLIASKRGKRSRTLPIEEAIAIANTHPVGQVEALCEQMLAGGDPLGRL